MASIRSMYPEINGYQLLEDWKTSGGCKWAYAAKDGRQWFIKQFMAPKYKRKEDGVSKTQIESSIRRCEAFRDTQTALYDKIKEANTGNIVAVSDFFSFETMFYAVSERVDISSVDISDVYLMPHEKKMILLKVLTHSISSLHKHGVVHADLKPDNILIKKTKMGYTLKLIDFDASFLESMPKRGEDICFDANFVAPETLIACNDETFSLDCKIDIFAMGLLFHLYYTGKMPEFPKGYRSICDALFEEAEVTLDSSIPDWLQSLICGMLALDRALRPDSEQVFQALLKETYGETKSQTSPAKGFHLPPKLPAE